MTAAFDTRGTTTGGSALRAAVYMLGLSILLFWLPLLGPLLAGFVGGRAARGPGQALVVALLPAVALGALLAVVLAVFDLPVVGALAGVAAAVAVAFQEIPLLLGAWVGGATRS
jgi:hypothetical protein